MSVDRDKLAELLDARDKLCGFCENHDFCEKCQVTLLIDDAYVEFECENESEEDDEYEIDD